MTVSRRTLFVSLAILVIVLAASGFFLRMRGASREARGSAAAEGSTGQSSASGPESFATDVAIPVAGAPVIQDTLVISVTDIAAQQTPIPSPCLPGG